MRNSLLRGLFVIVVLGFCGCDFVDQAPVRDGDYLSYSVESRMPAAEYLVEFKRVGGNSLQLTITTDGVASMGGRERIEDLDLSLQQGGQPVQLLSGAAALWVPKAKRKVGTVFDRLRAKEITRWEGRRVVVFSDGATVSRYDMNTGFLVGFDYPQQRVVVRLVGTDIRGLK